ncbi:hypothetical protein ACIBW9_20995 [Streptomyces sp. NPDC049541]|uniref:hypothetical protein n=1 Tax=Streptomyces sp. NPDC049541 TaxID=3365594 RepID=UPI00378C01FF
MSGANNGPTGPQPGQPPHGPSQGRQDPQGDQSPQGSQPPRWAWWVVGIVIPVVGILVTILLSGSDSSDDKSAEPKQPATQSSASTQATAPEEPTDSPEESVAAAKVLYGPVTFEVDLTSAGSRYLDLDPTAPVVMDTDAKSRDLTVSTSQPAPTLYTPHSGNTLALLPASGSAPTEAQCAEAVAEGGAYTGKAARGSRFCLTTNKGRTAYLSVVSAPDDRGIAKFKVTVWETPAA